MNIKRCVKCGKPLRADAEYCKGCGQRFSVSRPRSAINQTPTDSRARLGTRVSAPRHTTSAPTVRKTSGEAQRTSTPQKIGGEGAIHRSLREQRPTSPVSTPPASPHRAGHYSGLHPEDQPYQSSFMAVLRPPVPVVLSPSTREIDSSEGREEVSSNPNAIWAPTPEQEAATLLRPTSAGVASYTPLQEEEDGIDREEPDEFDLPMLPLPLPSQSPLPASSHSNAIWMPTSERRTKVSSAREKQNQPVQSRITTSSVSHREGKEPAPIALPGMGSNGGAQLIAPAGSPPAPVSPSYVPRTSRMQERAIPILLTIFCLVFLVAASLLASVFLSKRHQPITTTRTFTATPNTNLSVGDHIILMGTGFGTDDPISFRRDNNLLLLDRDSQTDALGRFTVQITVTSSWEPGLHTIYVTDDNLPQLTESTHVTIKAPAVGAATLQLQQPSNLTLDFGPGEPGAISTKFVTLTNGGGGQVAWKAISDASWLTVTPGESAFAGSQAVSLMVNRSVQPARAYSGHVTFTQQGGAARAFTISVSMSISAPPVPAAFLVLSAPSLSYSGSTGQNPASQTITLQNSGGRPLNWSGTAITGDGAPWLSIAPSSGFLDVNGSATVTVSIQSQQLPVGSYTGTVTFQGGANPQLTLAVTLSIVAPANLAVSPSALTLQASQGQQSLGQITIQDTGGQPLDWMLNASIGNGTNWLKASATSGHLNPAETQIIRVTADAGALAANSYRGTLNFSYGAFTKQVTIAFNVSLPPMPGIALQPSSLVFNATQGINPPAQTFTITNIGNASLNWRSTEDANGTTYAATSSSSSTSSLAPGKSITITVTPKVSSAGPGTITGLISVSDSDPGSAVPQQQVALTINVSSAAIISASPGNMVFNQTSTLTSSEEFLTLGNTGGAALNWSLAQGGQAPVSWLSIDSISGTVAPGTTTTVNVTCDSSQLAVGTYTATLIVSDSDPNSPVLSQTITVTLVVTS